MPIRLPGHTFLASVRVRLTVAVWTEESDIIFAIVERIAVSVVDVQSKGLALPEGCGSTLLAGFLYTSCNQSASQDPCLLSSSCKVEDENFV